VNEYRFIGGEIEMRGAPGAGAVIAGYGAVYDSPTTIGHRFREVVAPSAFTRTLKNGSDVRSYFNHDPSWPLARTQNETLTLVSDAHGLHYEVTLPDTQQARDLYALIERGDVSGSSFSFSVDRDGQEVIPAEVDGELPTRVLRSLHLYELGPVSEPAYEETDVAVSRAVRSLENAGLWKPEAEPRDDTTQAPEVPPAPPQDSTPAPEQSAQTGTPLYVARLAIIERQQGVS